MRQLFWAFLSIAIGTAWFGGAVRAQGGSCVLLTEIRVIDAAARDAGSVREVFRGIPVDGYEEFCVEMPHNGIYMRNLPGSVAELAERHESDVDGNGYLVDAEMLGLFLNTLADEAGYDRLLDATGLSIKQVALCPVDARSLNRFIETRGDFLGRLREDIKYSCEAVDGGGYGGSGGDGE